MSKANCVLLLFFGILAAFVLGANVGENYPPSHPTQIERISRASDEMSEIVRRAATMNSRFAACDADPTCHRALEVVRNFHQPV